MYLFRLTFIVSLLAFIAACEHKKSTYVRLDGFTMGTSFQITLEKGLFDTNKIQTEVDSRLAQINQLMSTYIDDSELSLFNQSSTLECYPLSKETMYVIENAVSISRQTNGKFDITLAPLIEIWGFDKKVTKNKIPSEQKITDLLTQVGFEKILLSDNCITKKTSDLSVNLSAIAKGYAVDEVAKILLRHNIENYLVEIGGEIANRGVNAKGSPWRLAIESASSEKRAIQKLVQPRGLGVATSGDYRNYFEIDGKRFSHTIDPTNGYPISHQLASVTVLHKETMLADALATAMMVMGPQESLAFADKNHIPIFMLVKTQSGFDEVYSQAFKPYLQ